jgi:hypothetical protein
LKWIEVVSSSGLKKKKLDWKQVKLEQAMGVESMG